MGGAVMSGGSYNYLCWNTDVYELGQRRSEVEAMAKRLEAMDYPAAARATRDVLRLLDGASRCASSLEDVWHAVEWRDSGDYGDDQVAEAVAKFKPAL